MKKYLLIIIALIAVLQLNAQHTVHVDAGGNIMGNLPYNNQFDYSWCTVIYPQDKINLIGDISQISYRLNVSIVHAEDAFNQKVYMAHTSDIGFTDAGYPDIASMTLVYDGIISYREWTGLGNTPIILTTPFVYNNTDNLIIHIENHDGTKNNNTNQAFSDYSGTTTYYPCKYKQDDGSFPETEGIRTHELPNIFLTFDPGVDAGVSKINNNDDILYPGLHDITVNFKNYFTDAITAVDFEWEVNGTAQTTYNWTGSLNPGQESAEIVLATDYDFNPDTFVIKAWTSNPNSGVDELNTNDTLTETILVADYIEIGSHSYNSIQLPYPTSNYFGWTASIYNSDSIQPGKIWSIAYNNQTQGYLLENQKIYLSQTSKTTFSSAELPAEESMNLVYTGDVDYSGTTGWKKIKFDSTFIYDNNNLQIHYRNYSDQYNHPFTQFAVSNYEPSISIYNGDNTSFPTTAGSASSNTPDIRLYFLIPADAGITSLDNPDTYYNTGNNNISVTLKNYGTDNLTSANINYQVDNGTIQTFNWTGNLPCYNTEENIIIGTESFTYGEHTLKIWTDSPNGLNDYKNENDTIIKTIYATNPLCGTYVIGSSPSDYLTLKEAVDSLNSAGVSCDVVFDIKPDIYNAQYMINEINDAGQNSTVTFQSQTGDSTDVILTTDSTDYLFNLNGADYLRFKHLTFTSDSADKLMVLDSGACNNVFENNQFIDGIYQIFNTETTIADTNNIINNNLFLNGNTAIYFYSVISAFETGNIISSNKFENQTGNSIKNAYQENLSITNNNIETTGYGLAIYSYLMKNCSITKNTMITSWAAMEFLGGYDTNLIANNFIICESNTSSMYSIKLQIDNIKFYNNTIKSIGEKSGNTLLQVCGDNNDIKNNILINLKAGNTIEIGWGYDDNTSNYNCLFSNGVSLAKWRSTECADLTTWQSESGLDVNSISTLPVFYSETDLHTNSMILDNAGTPLTEITDDIDGEPRNAISPDIGADEFTSTCTEVLKGEYTIGSSGDYATFNEAITALFDCGVDSSVTFNIETGTYNEQVLINDFITGYTENDTITFQSATGDSTSVILTYKADTLNNYTLKLNGINRFVFKQITIQSEDTTYGRVVEIGNGACNNLVQNCIISGDISDEDNNYQALVYFPADNASRDTSNTIQGNRFVNGSYGIYLDGGNNSKETFNTISGNYFINQSAYGIYADYQKNLLIKKNTIENNYQLDIYYYGIKSDWDMDSTIISKNIINIDRDYISFGLCLKGYNNLVLNNFISLGSNDYHSTGISGLGTNSKCYNNSVNIYGSGSPSALDVTYSTSGADIKNNILSNKAGGYALKCWYSGSQILSSDFNNLYSNGEYIADWLDVDIVDLSEWQTASGFGSNSVSSNPNFVSNTDLHTSNVLFNEAATPLPEVTDDIDGEPRDATNPDIGADEFTGVTFNLEDDTTVCVNAEYKIDAGVGFDTYLWSTGADSSYILVDSTGIGYSSEEYSVIVTLGAEQYKDTIIVTFSSPIAAPVDYFCYDENTDSVLITAGDGLYYKWSTGETTQSIWTSASSVSVTVTDANGCEDSDYIYRQWNSCPANFTMPDDTTICNNDSIIIDANYYCSADYGNYSYFWNTGDTTETITVYADDITSEYNEYSVEILNLSYALVCTTYDTVKVYRNLCPANLDMPDDTTIALNKSIVLDANSANCSSNYDDYTYLWSTDETTETITVNGADLGLGGPYEISVTLTNISTSSNCITSDMINVNVSSANAVETLVMDDISIYPNPTDGVLKLEFSNTIENTWIRIINVTGQVVYSEYLENLSGIKTLDLSGLDKGVYILSIQNKNTILTNKITLY